MEPEQEQPLRDRLAVTRTKLANERTVLAYARTALMLAATGVTLQHLYPNELLLGISGWLLVAAAAGLAIAGISRFRKQGRDLQ
jgi:putative membrane protein